MKYNSKNIMNAIKMIYKISIDNGSYRLGNNEKNISISNSKCGNNNGINSDNTNSNIVRFTNSGANVYLGCDSLN